MASGLLANLEVGQSWSSSSVGGVTFKAASLYFLVSNVLPMYVDNRSYGFPVRCVQVFI